MGEIIKVKKGIALVSLVVTIIILIILAGIVINLTIGENGIFKKVNIAKIENKRSQIIEYLDLKLLEERASNIEATNNQIIESTRENLLEYDSDLKGFGKEIDINDIVQKDEELFFYIIIDKEIYKVSIDGSMYLGKQSNEKIELQAKDIAFVFNPDTYTNENVQIEIISNKNIENYVLQYKTEKTGLDGEVNGWTNYTQPISLTRNQDIYARLFGVIGETTYVTGTISNIDKLDPKEFTPTTSLTSNSITVIASTEDSEKTDDNENSGILGYRFSIDDGNTWSEYQTEETYTFQNLTLSTEYSIKVEAKDNAGNTTVENITSSTIGTRSDLNSASAYNTGGFTIKSEGNYSLTAKTSGYEKLNIPIVNCVPENKYKLTFTFQVINGQFSNKYAYSCKVSNAKITTNDNTAYSLALTKNTSANEYSIEFIATAETMYLNFNIPDLSDGKTFSIIVSENSMALVE